MTDQNVANEVQRIETGGKDGKQMNAQQMQSEVTQIHDQMKSDPAAYRTFIDSVYRGIKGDAASNASLAGLLPVMDITDSTVDAANVGTDRGNFSGQDGLSYGNVQLDGATNYAKSWTDGQNGITAGANGALNSFSVQDGGVQVQGSTGGDKAQAYQWNYPGATVQPNADGNIQLGLKDGGTATITPDGAETVQMPDSGPAVTRPFAGSKDVTGYSLNGQQLIQDGTWSDAAPPALKGQPVAGFEIDPKSGNVTKQGDLTQVVAKVSDGKLVAGESSEPVQGALPGDVNLPDALGSFDRSSVKGYQQNGDEYSATLNNGDMLKFKKGQNDFTYTPNGGQPFDFHKNDDGGWTVVQEKDGAQVISIADLRIDNGVVKFSQKKPLDKDEPMVLTKDGLTSEPGAPAPVLVGDH